VEGHVVERRRDTRLYLGEQDSGIARPFGECVGAFYLQNPGSAASLMGQRRDRQGLMTRPWGPLSYGDEALLPTLEKVLALAVAEVRSRNARRADELCQTGYVQILNLSYIRNPADAKQPCQQWRRLVEAKRVREDCPPAVVRFIVFGWGDAFRLLEDSPRVTRVLERCVGPNTSLVFPGGAQVRSGEPVDVVMGCGGGFAAALRRKANYPCGGQHERTTYPALYARAVAPVIARSLLCPNSSAPSQKRMLAGYRRQSPQVKS
jgi:hypothetical protein